VLECLRLIMSVAPTICIALGPWFSVELDVTALVTLALGILSRLRGKRMVTPAGAHAGSSGAVWLCTWWNAD